MQLNRFQGCIYVAFASFYEIGMSAQLKSKIYEAGQVGEAGLNKPIRMKRREIGLDEDETRGRRRRMKALKF